MTDCPLSPFTSVAGDFNAQEDQTSRDPHNNAGCVKSETVADGEKKKKSRDGAAVCDYHGRTIYHRKQNKRKKKPRRLFGEKKKEKEIDDAGLFKTVNRIKPFPIGSSADITDREMRSE